MKKQFLSLVLSLMMILSFSQTVRAAGFSDSASVLRAERVLQEEILTLATLEHTYEVFLKATDKNHINLAQYRYFYKRLKDLNKNGRIFKTRSWMNYFSDEIEAPSSYIKKSVLLNNLAPVMKGISELAQEYRNLLKKLRIQKDVPSRRLQDYSDYARVASKELIVEVLAAEKLPQFRFLNGVTVQYAEPLEMSKQQRTLFKIDLISEVTRLFRMKAFQFNFSPAEKELTLVFSVKGIENPSGPLSYLGYSTARMASVEFELIYFDALGIYHVHRDELELELTDSGSIQNKELIPNTIQAEMRKLVW